MRAAHLRGASLVDADLTRTKLLGTDLSPAHGCTVAQIQAASVLDEATKLPVDIAAELPAIE
ncbi:pentapeptide repeat-containing protein [Streptomyces canus]|uniref:pentapeptide repeat-containing protein n=1 Tax=Streptomyces canus TaxID=58343 RepID=UPI0036E04FCE